MRFTGFTLRERVYEEMPKMDLLVSSSPSEGSPVAVLEAVAPRQPVALSDMEPR